MDIGSATRSALRIPASSCWRAARGVRINCRVKSFDWPVAVIGTDFSRTIGSGAANPNPNHLNLAENRLTIAGARRGDRKKIGMVLPGVRPVFCGRLDKSF